MQKLARSIKAGLSLFLTAFFHIGTTPESEAAAVTMNTVISDYTFATFMMLAALDEKGYNR